MVTLERPFSRIRLEKLSAKHKVLGCNPDISADVRVWEIYATMRFPFSKFLLLETRGVLGIRQRSGLK